MKENFPSFPTGLREFIFGRERGQRGSAMVAMLLVMAVLTGLGALIFNIGAANLLNTGRDRLAGGAMGAAEAGVAHALAYMRTYGVGLMTCDGPSTASALCSSGPWGYNFPTAGAGGATVTLNGGRIYRAWVQRIQPYTPGAAVPDGRYRIRSYGTGGSAGGSRTLDVDVLVRPFSYPIGLFGRDYIRGGGGSQITKESVFSEGCIGKRDRIRFDTTANDLAYPNLVPAAHSAKFVSNAVVGSESDPDCNPTERSNIHRPTTYLPPGPGVCNSTVEANGSTYRFDQDLQGGNLTGTLCDPVYNGGKGLASPPGSYFDAAALRNYGYIDPRGLPANQYAFLRGVAQEQGNFYDCTATPASAGCNVSGDLTSITPLDGNTNPNPVIYIKLSPNREFSLANTNLLQNYGQATCGTRAVMLVVEGGSLRLAANIDAVAAIFVPDGSADIVGNVSIVGTIFAKNLFFTGSSTFSLMSCFFDNLPGGVISANPTSFAEIDS